MQLLESSWKVTLGAVVLLDTEDAMTEEPKLTRSEGLQPRRHIGAAFASQRGLGQVAHTASFSRVVTFGSAALARAWQLSHTAALPAAGEDALTLVIVVRGGPTYELSKAALADFEITTEAEQVRARYTITGGALQTGITADAESITADSEEITADSE